MEKRNSFLWITILIPILVAATAHGEVTPMDAPLKEDGITRITCLYAGDPVTPEPGITFTPAKGEFHYDLYLPPGYNADPPARFACLFVASPGGNAKLGVMAERVRRDRFIAVMLVESKNGAWEPGLADFCSAHDDVVKRLRVAEGFKYMTGMSGGARTTSMDTALRPGFVGMFLQAAGFWQTPDGPYAMTGVAQNSRMGVYATFGTKDMNLDEAGLLAQYLPAKTAYHSVIFRGGHQWAPKPQVEEAFDWLEHWTYFELPVDLSETAHAMYVAYFRRLARHCEQAGSDFEKFEWMEKAGQFAASHHLDLDKALTPILLEYQKKVADFGNDAAVKKEIAARDAYVKAAASEELARRQAGRNVEKQKAVLPKTVTAYQTIADEFAGTAYGAKAKAAVERIKVEDGK